MLLLRTDELTEGPNWVLSNEASTQWIGLVDAGYRKLPTAVGAAALKEANQQPGTVAERGTSARQTPCAWVADWRRVRSVNLTEAE
jgi:hypothetical protein